MVGQLTITERLEQQTAVELMDAALSFIAKNPEAWDWLVEMAEEDAQRIGRIRIKRYIEDMRVMRFPWDTSVVKIPNAYSAPFGRIIRAWYPELAAFVPVAVSKCDGCVIPERRSL